MSRRTQPEQDPADDEGRGRGVLVACRGRDAVNRTEAALCGSGAVASVAAAQGVVAGGGRAAVLLSDGSPTAHPTPGPSAAVAWVGHRCRSRDGGLRQTAAFELLAADAQSAVDQCLVGHRLTARLGRPGLCAVDPKVVDALALVRLPDADATAFLDAAPDDDSASPDIPDATRRAFAEVAAWTKRPCRPLTVSGPEEAPFAVVAAGAAVAAAVAAAAHLATEGVACRVIEVALLHPAPEAELRAALAGAAAVAVADEHGSTPGEVELAQVVRSALWDRADCPVQALVRLPRRPRDLAASLRATFGIEPHAADADGSPQAEEPSIAVGFLPVGAWGEALLLDAAAIAGTCLPDLWLGDGCAEGVVVMSRVPVRRTDVDVLVVADPALLRDTPSVRVRPGGVVLVVGAAEDLEAEGLPAAPGELVQSGCRLRWLPDPNVAGPLPDDPRRDQILGALLTMDGGLRSLWPSGQDPLSMLVLPAERLQRLRAGAGALRSADFASPAITAPPRPPILPERGPGGSGDGWRRALRHFHLTGDGAWSSAEPLGALPLAPWALPPAVEADGQWRKYPLVVEAEARPLSESLADHGLGDYGPALCAAVASATTAGDPAPLAEVFDRAHVALGVDGALGAGLDTLRSALPPAAAVVGLGPETLHELLALASVRCRREPVRAFRQRISQLAQQLQERLRLDTSRGAGQVPAALSAVLAGSVQLDVEALARQLPSPRGSQRLGAERTVRMRGALSELEGFLAATAGQPPDLVLLAPAQLVGAECPPPGITVVVHEKRLESAPGYFDAASKRFVDLFRAVRTAYLDLDDARQPEHEEALRRLDWQGLTADELALVPPVVVQESAARVQAGSLSAYSDLLRSGRPVHLVVTDQVWGRDTHCGLGSLAMAHGDALVVQSSLARPAHLLQGLGHLVSSPRPSVAIVAVPDWDAPAPAWTQVAVASETRRSPCFRYDPEAGPSWADRFEMTSNPEPGAAWPTVEVRRRTADGGETTRREAFTFAHAAPLSPAWRRAFRVVPTTAWGPDQVDVAAWLNMPFDDRQRRIPYIWVDTGGILARAVMTRELAYACAGHLDEWHRLQELGGVSVKAAVEEEPAVEPEPDEAGEPEGAEEADSVAVARLVHALLGTDLDLAAIEPTQPGQATEAGQAAVAEQAAAASPSAAQESTAAAAEVGAPRPETKELVGDASIDSPLCTTCHDCINMNSRMFQYDDNKQAYIADTAAGTFAELVKAAEKCPARCIYPGAPRPGDSTVTDRLVQRARKFA